MPPEDELADEVPLRDENDAAPEADAYAASPSDSGVDFAVGDAPEGGEQQYDYDGPTEDLSGELAEDAGDGASYGYDTAAETARFEGDVSGLTDNAASPDDSDQYKMSDSDVNDGSRAAFADDAGTAAAVEDAQYEPAPEVTAGEDPGYASHHPDLGSGSHHPDLSGSDVATTEEVAEAAPEAAPEPEPEPAPAAEEEELGPAKPVVRSAPPPKPARPEPRAEPAASEGPKPGQVRKSAIDEMFARAAELKRNKK